MSARAQRERHVRPPELVLPESSLLGADTRAALRLAQESRDEIVAAFNGCPSIDHVKVTEAPTVRDCQAKALYATLAYQRLRDRYGVKISVEDIGGVPTEVFFPVEGVQRRNAARVLINLHGGAFQIGSCTLSQLESIPIAAVAGIKVVSVDYRMAPEYRFPAATEDVMAVYCALMQDHAPESIGIYGCSAGAMLAAQTVASLHKEGIALPAAIGMLCGAASYWTDGDSGRLDAALTGTFRGTSDAHPYFRETDRHDPSAFPVLDRLLLAAFPPSLLIAATRDLALSSVVHTHACLVREGVKADLHVWEGLEHAFHYYPDLPQAREVYQVVDRFFDKHLAT